LKNDFISTVKERPLILIGIETALTNIEKLCERFQFVGGDFVILWHNENLFRDYEKSIGDVFCNFLERNS
jgi:hypothetical protein